MTEHDENAHAATNPAKSARDGRAITRRSLIYGVGGIAALAALGRGVQYLGTQPAVRPPGGQDEDRLMSLCVRCQKCYEVCPHGIIKPAHIEQGVLGMRTPTLSFDTAWCDWCAEANNGVPKCVETCPTGALKLPDGATEENTILGRAVITNDWCLAYKLIGCKYCYDACPYDAIAFDEEGRPSVNEELCNGCGACEAACVSLSSGSIATGATHRAIVVEPIEG